LQPSQEEYDALIHTMNTHPAVPTMVFFDQDLLPIVYDDKWLPLPYIYNGLKTLRGCHADLWKDGDVKILHYILQKPWKSRKIDQDIVGIQHQLWWDEYNQLEAQWKAAKNQTRNKLWENIVEPQVAPLEHQHKSFTSGLPWPQTNPLAGKQLPAALQIPASYRTSEGVFITVLLAALLGFVLGRGSSKATKSSRESTGLRGDRRYS
jgi:lipopolysaccharide biosynthesis glycosyltransferase